MDLEAQSLLLLRAFASISRMKLLTAWAVAGLDLGRMSEALEQNSANLMWSHLMNQELFFNSTDVNGKTFDEHVKQQNKGLL